MWSQKSVAARTNKLLEGMLGERESSCKERCTHIQGLAECRKPMCMCFIVPSPRNSGMFYTGTNVLYDNESDNIDEQCNQRHTTFHARKQAFGRKVCSTKG